MSESRPQATRTTEPAPVGALDRFFEITRRGSTVGTEVRGGLVTFVTMAYIVVLNPIICLLYTSPSPRDRQKSRMPSSA